MPKKHNLTEEEVADLKEAFSMFDIDGDGKFRSRAARAGVDHLLLGCLVGV